MVHVYPAAPRPTLKWPHQPHRKTYVSTENEFHQSKPRTHPGHTGTHREPTRQTITPTSTGAHTSAHQRPLTCSGQRCNGSTPINADGLDLPASPSVHRHHAKPTTSGHKHLPVQSAQPLPTGNPETQSKPRTSQRQKYQNS